MGCEIGYSDNDSDGTEPQTEVTELAPPPESCDTCRHQGEHLKPRYGRYAPAHCVYCVGFDDPRVAEATASMWEAKECQQ